MSHLTLLLPFSLPPPELAPDLLKQLHLPALATLLARRASLPAAEHGESFDEFARALPHETWLARTFGLPDRATGSPPVAVPLMRACGLDDAATGTWFVLQPVHIHVARDHLVLTDPRRLDIAEDEARALFEIAADLFAEVSKTLRYGDAHTWFLRADDWPALATATPDAASGHNIDIWMARGDGERSWRKLQNEVQMHWFDHPLNQTREADGRLTINSIWLWGGSSAEVVVHRPYVEGYNFSDWQRAFIPSLSVHGKAETAADLPPSPQAGLALLDGLLGCALANDWASWLARMQALESGWFAPLLDALRAGRLARLSLVLSGENRLARFDVTRASLRKFWIRPTLSPLAS